MHLYFRDFEIMALVGYGSSSDSEEEVIQKIRKPKKIQAFSNKFKETLSDDDDDGPSPFKKSRPMGKPTGNRLLGQLSRRPTTQKPVNKKEKPIVQAEHEEAQNLKNLLKFDMEM